ncbi:MAG: NAD-dependent epimerase/dehydratase family protein [Alphaproteobacteria bacterium]|nr:NAD-dependent epimerase/dehydratase family protein [Alphaproteobacteria bacterium]
MAAATSGSRAQIVTAAPLRRAWIASAVPNAPPPMTAMRRRAAPLGCTTSNRANPFADDGSIMTDRPILVLGADGSFGGAVAAELLLRGRAVRAMVRAPDKLRSRDLPGAEIVGGDAEDQAALVRAAAGVGAIVHGINYPYHRRQPHMVIVTRNVIAAARAAGARIVFPGNVYGLGHAVQPGGPRAVRDPLSVRRLGGSHEFPAARAVARFPADAAARGDRPDTRELPRRRG